MIATPTLILPGQATPQRFAAAGRTALDLSRRHFDRKVRDLRVIGTWLRLPGVGVVAQPCLVLLPWATERLREATPCVVPLNSAWRWAEPDRGGDVLWAVDEARTFCVLLGKDPMRDADVMQVISTVADHVDDLVRMPPEPRAEARVVAEITGRIGDALIEQEVRDA